MQPNNRQLINENYLGGVRAITWATDGWHSHKSSGLTPTRGGTVTEVEGDASSISITTQSDFVRLAAIWRLQLAAFEELAPVVTLLRRRWLGFLLLMTLTFFWISGAWISEWRKQESKLSDARVKEVPNRYRTLDCGGMELVEVFSSFETPLSRCDRLSVSGISLRGILLDICTGNKGNIRIETRWSNVKIRWQLKRNGKQNCHFTLQMLCLFLTFQEERARQSN